MIEEVEVGEFLLHVYYILASALDRGICECIIGGKRGESLESGCRQGVFILR